MAMKTPQRLLIIVFFLAAFSPGCAKVAHLQELLRIKGYGDEKDAQAGIVQKQNEKFDNLLQIVKRGEIAKFANQKTIWMNFGPPIFETTTTVENVSYQLWIYRYPTQLIGANKVYLYFDRKGYLKIYDYSPGGTITLINDVAYDRK